MRNAPDLNARAIIFQRFFYAPFNGAIIATFLHVDEIDYN